MTMTDQNDQPTTAPEKPKPKPKRKWTRRKPKAAPATVHNVSTPAFLAGLSATQCADGCNATGCVISGKGYCAHPHKGGLHAASMTDGEAVRRFRAARLLLGTEALEKKFGK
jgi:hypothetical protein